MLLSFVSCENGDKTPDETIIEEHPEELVYKEDFIGIWCVKTPFSANEIKEFGKDLGLADFSTTAQLVYYVELKADGSAGIVKDIELLKAALKDSYYNVFYDAFTEARNKLSEEEFYLKIAENYGYQSYQHFLKGEVPARYADSLSHREFFRMACEEAEKYKNSPIEEQAAMGALWAEILEEVGNDLVYENGKWVANNKYNFTWDFLNESSTFVFNETEYSLNGDYKVMYLTKKDNPESKMTWYRK